MKKVLIWILVILLLAGAGYGGWYWYRETHIFVEDAVYAKNSQMLDLRGSDISREHFDSVHAQLPDCRIFWDVPFQDGKLSSDTTSLVLTRLSQEDLEMLPYFPELKSVDATGCSEYALLEQLCALYPELTVSYQVSLGQQSFVPDVTELLFNPGEFDYDTLLANLPHLSQVSSLRFENTDLTPEQLQQLRDTFPHISVSYSVELAGQLYEMDAAEADFSAVAPDQFDALLARMEMLPGITTVQLMQEDGTSSLTLENVKYLKDARPDIQFLYTFDFFGQTVGADTERLEFRNQKIGDENADQIRMALDLLDNCTYLLLDNCRLSNEVLSQLREEYRGRTKIVWRVWFGEGSCLTDAEVIRSAFDLVDDNCHDLVYCEDARYIDFGHNEWLDACEFVRGMPNLEFIILSGAPIKDLSPFENCKKLKILEIAFCMYVTDLSPLANCESLEMINIGATGVKDLSPLDNLPIKMLMGSDSKVSYAEQQRFAQVKPDCWATYRGNQYGSGWRYDKDDQRLPWYNEIAEIFGYPDPLNNAGWYLKTEED